MFTGKHLQKNNSHESHSRTEPETGDGSFGLYTDFFIKLTWHKMNDKFFFLTFTNYNGVLRVLSASHDAGNIAACLL